MQGIEIYKGRPIFYNQGNMGVDLVRRPDSPPNRGNTTGTEGREETAAESQDDPASVAYMANSSYKDGRLVEIRIYPVDVAVGRRPWSRGHIPETPSPELARSILERTQEYSKPFGTKISIENNIGIIRVPPEATVDVGGDLVIPGVSPEPHRHQHGGRGERYRSNSNSQEQPLACRRVAPTLRSLSFRAWSPPTCLRASSGSRRSWHESPRPLPHGPFSANATGHGRRRKTVGPPALTTSIGIDC
jgi:hypothetical protein